jgi:hypothetical protein
LQKIKFDLINEANTFSPWGKKIRRVHKMNKKYVKPELCDLKVTASESISAFAGLDGFSSFAQDITTYKFGSGVDANGGKIQ